jgi:hypothetical protein
MPTNITQGETFAKFIHHLREAQNESATLSHLARAMGSTPRDTAIANGWLAVSEQLKRMVKVTTAIAQGKLQ